jgi:asparagine synthase (glutamine-hydrolysing)
MCGIAGLASIDHDHAPGETLLRTMIATLHHRGPDGYGLHSAPGIGLAHARLSIIDLASGDQPIRNEDGTVWVVFNGEIFNYVELRPQLESQGHRFYTQSDTECIVHAYEQYDLDFVDHLNGQFAIALWDARRKRLVLARDRVGIRPLLYAETRCGLAFASEAKSLFASGLVTPSLDPMGIAQVATFWGSIAPRTAFRRVAALPPGHIAVYEDGRLRTRCYWDWRFAAVGESEPRSLEEAVEETRTLFEDAVRLQLRADVPVGAYLSGGLDSSAVTAAITRASQTPLTTFSLAFSDAEFDESTYQQEVSRHLRTSHVVRRVDSTDVASAFVRAIDHIESPIVRTAGIPLMLLADSVRNAGIKVTLTGEGADEIFGGYDIFKEGKIRRFWAKQPASARRPMLFRRLYGYLKNSPAAGNAMASAFYRQGLDSPDDPYYSHRIRWTTTQRVLRFLSAPLRDEILREGPFEALMNAAPVPDARWPGLARDQYVEAHTLLTGYLLHAQGDRVAMAASIEARYPFLDHRLVEFANRLPPRWKIRGLREKYILRTAVSDWLPNSVTQRTKQPYRAPDSSAFFDGGRLVEPARSAMNPRFIEEYGYFDPSLVERLVQKCAAGKALGFADNMTFVTILSTQVLHSLFVRSWVGETALT